MDTTYIITSDEVPIPERTLADTPVGDREKKPKVHLGIELREKNEKKKILQIVEVWVFGVKNLPQISRAAKIPSVKLQMAPDPMIFTTELQANRKEADQYNNVDRFIFPIDDFNASSRTLNVQVYNGKLTRNSKVFGSTNITLEGVTVGNPIIQWHELLRA